MFFKVGESRWDTGYCGEYAEALRRVNPGLSFGSWDDGVHFFAHDKEFVYDITGKRPLGPLLREHDMILDDDPEYWGVPEDEDALLIAEKMIRGEVEVIAGPEPERMRWPESYLRAIYPEDYEDDE